MRGENESAEVQRKFLVQFQRLVFLLFLLKHHRTVTQALSSLPLNLFGKCGKRIDGIFIISRISIDRFIVSTRGLEETKDDICFSRGTSYWIRLNKFDSFVQFDVVRTQFVHLVLKDTDLLLQRDIFLQRAMRSVERWIQLVISYSLQFNISNTKSFPLTDDDGS